MYQKVALFLALAAAANAHYTFGDVSLNGVQQGQDWTYVRPHGRGYQPTFGDNITTTDFRCQPGADLGPGPAQVYVSKAPRDHVKSYDGSGEWFKVREATLCSDISQITTTSWCTWGQPGIAFTIPKRLPDGEYLVRPEHVAIHESQGTGKGAQYYYSCAHFKVQGNTGKTWLPTRTAKIPGMIKENNAGVSFNIWNPYGITSYPYTVGSELIVGGTTWGNPTGSSDAVKQNVQKRDVGGSAAAQAAALMRS